MTKEQWIGTAGIVVIALGVIVGLRVLKPRHALPEPSVQVWGDSARYERTKAVRDSSMVQEIHLRNFDPNMADSITFIQLGLKPWQVRSILNYRRKHGRYREAEDFRKVYQMTDSQYLAIRPYIKIDTTWIYRERMARQAYWDSIHRADSVARAEKYAAQYPPRTKRDTLINLNTADTSDLKLIRGIGSYTARKIVRYRQALGGFYSVDQLRDAELGLSHPLKDSTLAQLYIEENDVKTIALNYASVGRLAASPYLNYAEAKAIYEYRISRPQRRIRSWDELYRIPGVDSVTITRVRPYLRLDD